MDTPETGLRLLIVDNNKDFTDLLATGLRGFGHCVMCVNNSTWALGIARYFRPHAVLTALVMHHLDGLSLARQVREAPELKGVRLIAGIGCVEPPQVRRCADADFDVYLEKPFTHKELQAVLSGAVAQADG
jgi:two-component system, OmpR family, response regulator